jgi:predicted glutamine amidotransferase
MCQLLGMNCNTPTDIVFSFTGFAMRGGATGEHQDGWGIAFFEGPGVRHLVDHRAAIHSPLAELIKHNPIKSQNVIAHIRKATQGRIALENCHPFVRECWGLNWVFAHNGDLKDFNPTLDGQYLPIGSTDSELAFCHILEQLRAGFGRSAPDCVALTKRLRELCADIAQHGTFNMMLSNGEALFVHCSTNMHYLIRQFPFQAAQLADHDFNVDFSTVTTPTDRVAVIATEPLTTNETWQAFGAGELRVFVDGACQI